MSEADPLGEVARRESQKIIEDYQESFPAAM